MNPLILYNNKALNASISVTGTSGGYDKNNMLDYRSYTYWKAGTGGTNYITIQFSSNEKIDSLGICGHNLLGMSIDIEYYNAGWINLTTKSVLDYNAFLLKFTETEDIDYRIKITSSITPKIAVMFLGKAMEFPYPPNTPITPFEESMIGEYLQSKTGNLLGSSTRFNVIKQNHEFRNFNKSWLNNSFIPFWENHGKKMLPFFYAWDHENAENEVFYTRFTAETALNAQRRSLNIVDNLQLNLIGQK